MDNSDGYSNNFLIDSDFECEYLLMLKECENTIIDFLNTSEINDDEKCIIYEKVKGYKLIKRIEDLKIGSYIRWFLLNENNISEKNYFGILCKIFKSDKGIFILCKNFMHRHYTFKFNECVIFQKLTKKELMLIDLLHYIESN